MPRGNEAHKIPPQELPEHDNSGLEVKEAMDKDATGEPDIFDEIIEKGKQQGEKNKKEWKEKMAEKERKKKKETLQGLVDEIKDSIENEPLQTPSQPETANLGVVDTTPDKDWAVSSDSTLNTEAQTQAKPGYEQPFKESFMNRWITKFQSAWNKKAEDKLVKKADSTDSISNKTFIKDHKPHKFEEMSELDATPTKDEIRDSLQKEKELKKGAKMEAKLDKMDLENEEVSEIKDAKTLVTEANEGVKQAQRQSMQKRIEAGNAIVGNENMDKLKESLEDINHQLNELKPVITSIKIGWLSKIKVNSEGYITNLPPHKEQIVIDKLVKQKEQLGESGKTEEANEVMEQIEALEKYSDLLLKRDKLTTN